MSNINPAQTNSCVTNKLSYIVIPGWIEPWIKSSGLKLTALLDPSLLSSILSKRDVSFYVYNQYLSFDKLPKAVTGCFNDKAINHIANVFQPEYVESREKLLQSFYLENKADSIRPLIDGSFEKDGIENYTFEVIEITPEVFGIRLKAYSNDEPVLVQEKRAYSNLLNILNLYEGFTATALSPAMERFVALSENSAT